MQIPPFPQSAISLNYTALVPNASRPVGLNQAKFAKFPSGVYVAETGFHRGADRSGKRFVECEYLVPWGAGPAFEEYVLGSSDAIASPGTDATGNPLPGVLTRTIPLQCPEPGYFTLYAVSCDLQDPSRTSGACYANPQVLVRDGTGSPTPDPNLAGLQQAAADADAAVNQANTDSLSADAEAVAADAAAKAADGVAAAAFDNAEGFPGDPTLAAAYQAARDAATAAHAAAVAAHAAAAAAKDAFANAIDAAAKADAAAAAAVNGIPIDWPCWIDGSTGKDGLARYKVRFQGLPFTVRDDGEVAAIPGTKQELERYVERHQRVSISSVAFPAGSVVYMTGPNVGGAIPANGTVFLNCFKTCEYTWHEVPDVPEGAINLCIGKVNSQAFDGARGSINSGAPYAPGQLLFQGPMNIERYEGANRRFVHRIVYSFLFRSAVLADGTEAGWNAVPDSNGKNQKIGILPPPPLGGGPVNPANATPVYKSADFNALFQLGVPVQY